MTEKENLPVDRTGDSTAEVAGLAYSYYEARGREDGHDVEDWLKAEQELKQRIQPSNRQARAKVA